MFNTTATEKNSRLDIYDNTSTNEEIEYEKYKKIPNFIESEDDILWFISVETKRLSILEWIKYKNAQQIVDSKTIEEQEARELLDEKVWEKIQQQTNKKAKEFYRSIIKKNISFNHPKSLEQDT